ncbi:MAG: AAA-like domain-containing protein [Cyanobacteria bacterium J069]|nr:MAG: hypothetical protein D6742_16870 [Cyanobacteria bacterium J069]
MINLEYPVGGSLAKDNPFYVQRIADVELHEAVQTGSFCYVFNSRQMGKSSLLVRSRDRLEQEGWRCCTIDLTSIGSETVTPLQWYKGVAFELWRGFDLRHQVNFRSWWQDESDLSVLQRLQHFISDILLTHFADPLVIFIDEIDGVLSLPFAVDDFFALIRFCYNQRAIAPCYNRISFVLAGVATPSDLIQDRTRTPFNIGRAIELTGFDYDAATPLLRGLEAVVPRPETVLREILSWTGGQPFLTQKLCQLAVETARQSSTPILSLPPGAEAFWVGGLVRGQILQNWESQDEPEHLRTIRDRLERSRHNRGRLLGLYQQILQATPAANAADPPPPLSLATDSREQIELLLSGLVVKQQGALRVKNRIYQAVFNLDWVSAQLASLRPYSQSLEAWIASEQQDTSRLLRGRALQDAQQWAQDKTLGDRDYQFLAASQACDRQEVQQALEAARLQEVEARLAAEQHRRQQEQRAAHLQRLLLLAASLALAVAAAFGFTLRRQYQAALRRERQTKLNEIAALVDSSRGLFASNQKLDALIAALKARTQFQSLDPASASLQERVDRVLQQAISGADEYNRLANPPSGRYGLAVSPDGQTVVTSGQSNTLNLWTKSGQFRRTLSGHTGPVLSLAISPQGDRLVSGSRDRTLRLWQLDGTFFRTLEGHQGSVLAIAFSPDGQVIASGSDDTTIRLWRPDGTLLRTLPDHQRAVLSLMFTPSGELISSSEDGTVKRWSKAGELQSSFQAGGNVLRVAIHPNDNRIATALDDQTIKLWTFNGTLLNTLRGHTSAVNSVAFSTDGNLIASASSDRTIKLWNTEGILLKTFAGHAAPVTEVAFVPTQPTPSPNRPSLVSLAWDHTVRFWQPHNSMLTALTGHTGEVGDIALSPGGTQLTSVSADQTIRRWQIDQQNGLQALPRAVWQTPGAIARTVAIHPGGRLLATAGTDQTITLWHTDGTPQQRFKAHNSDIRRLVFSADGRWLASASTDSTIKVWNTLLLNQLRPLPQATLTGHQSGVFALSFNPAGRVLASASSDGTVKLWTPDGRLLSTFRRHQQPVWAIAFSPTRHQLASAGEDQKILIWQPDGTVLNTLSGHESTIRAIAFNPSGSMLASGSQDGIIKLWTQDGTLLTTLQGHSASITSLLFSPDQQLLLSASEDNSVLLWNLDQVQSSEQIVDASCEWVKEYEQTQLKPSERSLCDAFLGRVLNSPQNP